MLRGPREDHTSPADVDETTDSLDGTPLDGGPGGSCRRPIQGDDWLSGALEALPREISRLPDLQRRLLVGAFYEERPVEELARELYLTPPRATMLLVDALRTLRENIGG